MEEIKEANDKSEEEENRIVHVKVRRGTRERLKLLGKKGDTYEDLISALVSYELKRIDSRENKFLNSGIAVAPLREEENSAND